MKENPKKRQGVNDVVILPTFRLRIYPDLRLVFFDTKETTNLQCEHSRKNVQVDVFLRSDPFAQTNCLKSNRVPTDYIVLNEIHETLEYSKKGNQFTPPTQLTFIHLK